MKLFILTVPMGKRLIGKAMAKHPMVQSVLKNGTLVIVAGTTNGYVAEEILSATGQLEGFCRRGFRRGMTVPPRFDIGTIQTDFPGDVVLVKGQWKRGKEIFDVAESLQAGDMILKGANALDLRRGHAAVLVAHPSGGTAGAILPAVMGRRVRLIIPIGLEKRSPGNLTDVANELNSPSCDGPRLMPLPGTTFTELDAIALLTGAAARLVAAGGVCGAEGAVWVSVTGQADQVEAAAKLINSVANEPPCQG